MSEALAQHAAYFDSGAARGYWQGYDRRFEAASAFCLVFS
jgi:hypothetical protein